MIKYYQFIIAIAISLLICSIPSSVFSQQNKGEVSKPTPHVSDISKSINEESTTSAVKKEKSDYVLPYPGILPDHPLYFLKELRDKIIEALIVDPERKSEFYLLQSDKLLNSAVSLLEKNNEDKTKEAIQRSSEKMRQAVSQLSIMKQSGKTVSSGSIDRIVHAIDKHIEVLEEMGSSIETKGAIEVLQKLQGDAGALR